MIKILIAEDNLFSQKALVEKISNFEDLKVKAVANNGEELIELLQTNSIVDVILMDLDMPKMDGVKATEWVKNRFPQIKIVVITIYDDDEHIFNAIKAGADSYILKDSSAEKIQEAIHQTLSGGAIMSPSIALKTLHFLKNYEWMETQTETEDFRLSQREVEVLDQVSKGLKNKSIAENLCISVFTVKNHIDKIYKKIQAKNRVELIYIAKKNRLI